VLAAADGGGAGQVEGLPSASGLQLSLVVSALQVWGWEAGVGGDGWHDDDDNNDDDGELLLL
jgi:hypothetical protein